MPRMDTSGILAALRAERKRIDKAISALSSIAVDGRPTTTKATTRKKRKGMSAAGRRAISRAQKARWAAQRKKSKAKVPF